MMSPPWVSTDDQVPLDGVVVWTKLHDENGLRAMLKLKLVAGKWWSPDESMMAHYTPTHWRPNQDPSLLSGNMLQRRL